MIETLDLWHSVSCEWGVTPHQCACSTQTRGLESSFRTETACSSLPLASAAPATLPPRQPEVTTPLTPFPRGTCSGRGRSQGPRARRTPGQGASSRRAAEQRLGPSPAGARDTRLHPGGGRQGWRRGTPRGGVRGGRAPPETLRRP